MRKIIYGFFALSLIIGCSQDNVRSTNSDEEQGLTTSTARRECPSEEIRAEALKNDTKLMARYAALEASTAKFMKDLKVGRVLADGTVEIPVVVNVLYRTSAENISDAQINSQITTLNQDYGGTNSDINKIPAEFLPVAAGNTSIKFRLANTVRKSTSKRSWRTNDDMKKASKGGIDATSPNNYLNIWVVGDMGSILGYATFPESAGLWNDGVVIAAKYFGNTSYAPYNLGRTATHEIGHYLNLRHIWGDSPCATDYVDDTPTQTGANYGTPVYPLYNSCGGVSRSVMFMNYMDYVNDAAMFMFSAGQRARMQSVTTTSGARAGLRLY